MNIDPNVISLVGIVLFSIGMIGLAANAVWATHLEAKFEDWEDEEDGL